MTRDATGDEDLPPEEGEAFFRAAFERAPVGIAHIGLDGRWLRVNERLCRLLGYSLDELHARSFRDLTHAEDLEENGIAPRTSSGSSGASSGRPPSGTMAGSASGCSSRGSSPRPWAA